MRDFLDNISDRQIGFIAIGLATFASIVALLSLLAIPSSSNPTIADEPQVFRGERGESGNRGPRGEIGDRGEPGIQGLIGEKGEKGDTGEPGETVGIPGPQGLMGLVGLTGAKGDIGATGVRGLTGEPGFLYPTPLSLSAPTFNYPIVVADSNGFIILSVSKLGQELGGGTIRPKVDLTNRQAFRLQFTHSRDTEVIKVGLQYLSSQLIWESLIPAFGEKVGANVPQSTPFIAIPQFVGNRDFTTRITVYGDNNTDVHFSYLAIDAR